MLELLQIIKVLNSGDRAILKDLCDNAVNDTIGFIDLVEVIETMYELTPYQLRRLERVINNGSYKSAFKVA